MEYQSTWCPQPLPAVAVAELVLRDVDKHPDRVALVDAVTGEQLTYAELRRDVYRAAAGLQAWGLRTGDVVGVYAPNCPDYAVVFFGIATAGAVSTTANPAWRPEELHHPLADAGAVLLITTAALLPAAREAAKGTKVREILTLDPADGARTLRSLFLDGPWQAPTLDPAVDLVALPYSSGTTGLPKGVMLTHRNLVANLIQVGHALREAQSPALIGFLPFFHIYGMVVIMSLGLLNGSTIVTMARFDLPTFLRALTQWPIRMAHVVPPVVLALAKHPSVDPAQLRGLRWLFSGAAPLGLELTDEVQARLGVEVLQGYGMTEASPATHVTPPGGARAGAVGPLVPDTSCRIVRPDTGEDAAPGEPGEVWVKGPQVMRGYLNQPAATAATVDAQGWLHTGDLGVVDADGYLTILDRIKELIKVRGNQVAPAELESLLLKHPAVADVAVIPVADPEAGEVPKALVVRRADIDEAGLIAWVASQVAHYKRIRVVQFVDTIPKSPSGKILRRLLVAQERAQG